MVNKYNISINYKVKSYKMTCGSKRNITERHRNLSVVVSSTGTTGGEVGLVFIFWLLLVLLIGLHHLV
jgi:tetrahydromethanopterin S-methyltransferase subunit F